MPGAVVAFLGLGTMGGPMAANLARAGFTVRGWNRNPSRATALEAAAAGVLPCASIAEAVRGADFVATCVGDGADVEQVLLGDGDGSGGAAPHMAAGATVIDFSTIGTAAARRLHEALAERGLSFLDAPVTGGDVGARAGTLTVMVGGHEAVFARAGRLFAAVGSTARRCGDAGAGQAVKLCNQVLAALHMVGLTEALLLARRQGVDPALVVELCSKGAAGSWALANLGPKVAARDFAPGFQVRHLLKDLRLVLQAPPGHGMDELRGVVLAENLLQRLVDLGAGEFGTQALTLAYEKAER